MSLHYILDGYNIMRHASYRPRGRAKDPRYGLIAHVRDEGLCGSARNTVTVVFDGYPAGFTYEDSRFHAVFSGSAKADDRIKAMVETADRANTIVVSDDREIAGYARLHGIKVEPVEDFLTRRRGPAPREDESSKPELTYDAMNRINRELRDKWLK